MSQVLDYSMARPDPAAIKAAGYVGVLRYVAPAEDAPKLITKPEYDALLAHGLTVCLNWEWYANRPREGAAAGTADATSALAQAKALGYTGAIYFSVDYDAPESDQAAINAYFVACAAVIGKARLGAYGGYWPLSRLFDANLMSYGWQTLAWSGGNREARAHLYQNGAQVMGGCDVNDVLKPNWAGGSMVPDGWTDDPTNKILTAPNGIKITTGFRLWILAHAWDADNVPLAAEHAVAQVSSADPSLGAGTRMDCVKAGLGWSRGQNKIIVLPVGKELAAALAAPHTPTQAPSKADLAMIALKAALE